MSKTALVLVLLATAATAGIRPAWPPGLAEKPFDARWTDPGTQGIVADVQAKHHLPGLSYAVLHHGRLVASSGAGRANLEHGTLAGARTVYRLGSISKLFTALSIMLLAQDGALALDDRASRFVPEYPHAASMTIRQLLNHTSGAPELLDTPGITRHQGDSWTAASLIAVMAPVPLLFPPGQRCGYSNLGYVLLGQVIQKAAGMPYATFVRRRILAPLGMAHTWIGPEGEAAVIPLRAAGYRWQDGRHLNAAYIHMSAPLASGDAYSSVEDLALLDQALVQDRLITRASLAEMLRPGRLPGGRIGEQTGMNFGLAWEIFRVRGHVNAGKSGGIEGFSTQILRFDDGWTAIGLCNLQETLAMEELCLRLAESFRSRSARSR